MEKLLKTIIDGTQMTKEARDAFGQLLKYTAQLQNMEAAVTRMRARSQQFIWIGFPKPDGRWLVHEANLFSGAVNEKTNNHT